MSLFSPLTSADRKPSKKPRMLVVDDESMNLDLLYRTFRRKFDVFRAESGTAALEVLSKEGEVAVIISDQRMPEMKGTEFLRKTVANFPDTARIILTGFTDSSDLVDAINAGQVYRYITKPWDDEELSHIVNQALEIYEQNKRQHEAMTHSETQSKLIATVGQVVSQSMETHDALTFLAKGFGQAFRADACTILLVEDSSAGSYGRVELEAVRTNRLLQAAVSTQRTQSVTQLQSDETLADNALYAGKTECHIAQPIFYRENVLAVLSLQWDTSYSALDDVTQLLNLMAPLLASSIKTFSL